MGKKQRTLLVILLLLFTLACAGGATDADQTPPTPAPVSTDILAETESVPVNLETQDVSYSQMGHESQTLDIYLPENSGEPAPVMIYVHGGAWAIGDKARVHLKDDVFNQAGYIFISINYRLYPDATWDEMAADVALSIAWVHEHISAYGGDPERVFLMGHSAGAHLVSLVATDEQYLQNARLDLDALSGVVSLDTRAYNIPALAEDEETLPRAYAPVFGDDPQGWEAASPLFHVEAGKNIPPIAIAWSKGMAGDSDNAAGREAFAREFSDALNAADVPTLLVDGSAKTHAEINRQFGESDDVDTTTVMDWLAELNGQPSALPDSIGTFNAAKLGTVEKDITYCTMEGVALKMDIYYPSEENGAWPVALYVHGGGWTGGDKSKGVGSKDIPALVDAGFLTFSVNYRLAPEYPFPAMIEDVKCAVRSLRAHADEYNLDPERIGVWGSSAGGHLVSLLGTTDESSDWDVGEYLDQSSRVQAVVDMFGPADLLSDDFSLDKNNRLGQTVFNNDADLLALASPVNHVSPDDPPFLLLHGLEDKVVPPSQSQILFDVLQEAGVLAELIFVENASHGFAPAGSASEPSRAEITEMVVEFFSLHLMS